MINISKKLVKIAAICLLTASFASAVRVSLEEMHDHLLATRIQSGESVTDLTLDYLSKKYSDAKNINLNGSNAFTDAGMQLIKEFKKLEYLSIKGASISESGFEHLRNNSTLVRVDFVDMIVPTNIESILATIPTLQSYSINGIEKNIDLKEASVDLV